MHPPSNFQIILFFVSFNWNFVFVEFATTFLMKPKLVSPTLFNSKEDAFID